MNHIHHLENFFKLSLDLFCLSDFRGYFVEVNPRWEELLGYTRDDLLSRPFIDFVHPDDVASTILLLKNSLREIISSTLAIDISIKMGTTYGWSGTPMSQWKTKLLMLSHVM
jgi:PAS domain S-box-containing protein